MSERDVSTGLSAQDQERLKGLWAKAVEPVQKPGAESIAQALALGVNFRVHLGHALAAAWETTKTVMKTMAATHTAPVSWFLWAETAADAIAAVFAIFAALVQRMRPIDYVTAVVLAAHPDGVGEAQLQKDVDDFLNDPRSADFSWHLGMSEGLARRAKEVATDPDWLSDSLKELRKAGFLDQQGAVLKFKSRNFEIGLAAR